MERTGLVLEGGGMRGVYTAGVLDYLLDKGHHVPYVVGVSAGACNATSYISRQPGRNKKVTVGYIADPRYLSIRNLWRERSLFGMNFIFDQLPNELVFFDFTTFYGSEQELVIGTTDAITGEAVFYRKSQLREQSLKLIRASSSLPFASPPVSHEGKILFDGGIAAPIPIDQSILDGNERHIVVLTQPATYRKKPFRYAWLAKRVYPRYPGLVKALTDRARVYNETLDRLEAMEREGRVLIIRPSADLAVGRMEKNEQKLEALFQLGYEDARRTEEQLSKWLQEQTRLQTIAPR